MRERSAGAGPVALALVAVFAVAVLVAEVAELGTTAFLLVTLGPFAVFGAVVARWWTLVLPLVCSGVYIGIRWVIDEATGECSICTSDESWDNYPIVFLVLGTLPVTLVLLVGLVIGWLVRR